VTSELISFRTDAVFIGHIQEIDEPGLLAYFPTSGTQGVLLSFQLKEDQVLERNPYLVASVEKYNKRMQSEKLLLTRSVMLQSQFWSISKIHYLALTALLALLPGNSPASDDARILVEMPQMTQEHMLSNMRDHLVAVNEILLYLGQGELEKAAEISEYRLGMSSLESHGASHMAKFMPEGMRQAGTAMHKAASRFSLKVQAGDVPAAYKSLSEITSACVACHSGYRGK